MKNIYVKIYGERNSGTQYLHRVIDRNFTCKILEHGYTSPFRNISIYLQDIAKGDRLVASQRIQDIDNKRLIHSDFGWKHGNPQMDAIKTAQHRNLTLFLAMTKNPYFWAKSFYERPYANLSTKPKGSFSEFLTTPWVPSDRDNTSMVFFDNPIHMWNEKIGSVRQLESYVSAFQLVRYEDMLTSFEPTLERIGQLLHRAGRRWENVTASPKGDPLSFADYQQKYSPDRIAGIMSREDILFISGNLDAELMRWCRYELVA
ncbi:MAG: hypothetical protein H0T75_20085 [Rhizobiales bacterium]|nr:hypothetical protein [Hyphomicrobiales bacterium]MDQ3559067.1 hypothetical protein [Pseudomonadota bacterium]